MEPILTKINLIELVPEDDIMYSRRQFAFIANKNGKGLHDEVICSEVHQQVPKDKQLYDKWQICFKKAFKKQFDKIHVQTSQLDFASKTMNN